MTFSEEPEVPEGAENESGAEAGRSEEPGPVQGDEATRAASGADPSSSPQGDELAEAVDASAPASEEAEAPKRPRRRRRRRGAEAGAAGDADAGGDAEGAAEPEAAAEPAEVAGEPEATAEPAAESAQAELAEEPGAAESEEPAADEAEEPVGEEPEEPAAPAAPARPTRTARRRRGAERDPSLPSPVVRAQAKYVRSSARKARLVCDHIRGKSVEEARAILALTPRAIARDWSKLLESAVANAEHNHELVGEDLYVKAVHADEGPTIKRFRPRAMGRATRIRKRTSHLTILLTPKD
jgi:ribosomal protein L22